ncbi:hypothetical protein NDU88_002866 [Pleurodeles waltl]|uniref:Uncharacterized protein n=1 Tax=Pleurodeles waltl TaxID=8319 RepID=A0AAV7KTB3_PLEWA|nr:hypothetical protein NDU88_002866 [Pleurodeles waltl]
MRMRPSVFSACLPEKAHPGHSSHEAKGRLGRRMHAGWGQTQEEAEERTSSPGETNVTVGLCVESGLKTSERPTDVIKLKDVVPLRRRVGPQGKEHGQTDRKRASERCVFEEGPQFMESGRKGGQRVSGDALAKTEVRRKARMKREREPQMKEKARDGQNNH